MALLGLASKNKEGIDTSTVIAIDRDKNSQYALKWAVDNLLKQKKNPHCILIHVRSQRLHPQDEETAPREGRPPTEDELRHFFLPYRGFCARKGVQAREVVLHDIDVPGALADYVSNNSITNIVVGACSHNAFVRKLKNSDIPTNLLKSAPGSCSVYVISRGKVQSKRLANQSQSQTSTQEPDTPRSNAATPRQSSLRIELSSCPPHTPDSEDISSTAVSNGNWRDAGPDRVSFNINTQINQNGRYKHGSSIDSPRISVDSFASGSSSNHSSLSGCSDISGPPSFRSTDTSSDNLEMSLTSEASSKSTVLCNSSSALEAEMKKLRLELKQTMEMYNTACKEAIVARHRALELQQLKTEEEKKLEEAKLAEEAAVALAEAERQKSKAATEAAQMAQQLAEMEIHKRKNAELKAMHEAEEKKKAVDSLVHNSIRCRRYTIEDIEVATDYFNNSNKIGEGGYGPVYKGLLDHTAVAIKVLRPDLSQGQRQFQQEVEVLSCIRHPNMVLLVGACPEYGCLVYEYMENGSLEDRLFQRGGTSPIPWRARFRIASEIATGLLFLHQTKPEPLVHRDLKPANILLNENYVSKISDVGLARLVPASVADSVTQYRLTAAAGTFCYIDPEYQQTGMLGVKSDVYSLGVMLLQIITAKPAMGLSHIVEEAIKNDKFSEILDPAVTDWPVEEALSFAKLALKCCELRKRDRPDLGSDVLPELNRLRDFELNNAAPSESLDVTYESRPYKSVPQLGSSENKINVRRRWQRLKFMTRIWSPRRSSCRNPSRAIWSFKNSFAKSSLLPPTGKQYGKFKIKKQPESCWSFVSCSSAYPRLKKFNSFS